MEKQTLVKALNIALNKQLAGKAETPNARDILLAALNRRTMRIEQIAQRRMGQHHSHMTILK